MGGTESKTDSTAKTEVNTSLIQFHWESYGWGAASIVLCILLLGMIIILFYFLRMWCCKVTPSRSRTDCGFDPWLPLGPMNTSMNSMGALPPYSPNMMEIWVPETTQQLALSSAINRLHNERVARLQNLP